MSVYTNRWIDDIEAMEPGDPCEFRYPAREEALPGIVVTNGGGGYWTVQSTSEHNKLVNGLYAEHIKAPGGLSCSDWDDEDVDSDPGDGEIAALLTI